jgi:16S rRNA (cytidine1402-2'-O)-methyltransferase
MSGSLKVVSTPIGNVRDISLRAIDEIERADIIFAEDTRHSKKLIQSLSIKIKPDCKFISCDAHKEKHRIAMAIEFLKASKNILFISDAGCPTISDPGSFLVQGVITAGFLIEVIPGPSAHSAALMGAGIDTARFAFLGFLPQKKIARRKLILSSAQAGLALVFYESPLRMKKLLEELFLLLGNRRVVVARELTKIYETFHRGFLGEDLNPSLLEKGECVVVVEAGAIKKNKPEFLQEQQPMISKFIESKLSNDESIKDIVRQVADKFFVAKKDAYLWVVRLKKLKYED